MSHISEGLLHAHLDGAVGHDRAEQWLLAEAHLSVCEDCRWRLEEARQLRDAAGGILAVASAPSASKPGFQELVAKAGTAAPLPRRKPWWNSTSRLAWAASLVLAIGAGWLGRELLIQTGQDMPAVVAESEAIPPEPEQKAGFRDAVDDEDTAADQGQARTEAEEIDRVAGDPNSRGLAVPPANEPEVAVMRKSEEQQGAVESRQDAEPARERDVVAQMSSGRANAPTCYVADLQGDLQRGLAVADRASSEDDRKNTTPIAPSEIRLQTNGMVLATAGGQQIAGSWEAMGTDSVRVTLETEEADLEMRFEQTDTGLVGIAVSSARAGALNEADPAGAGRSVLIRLQRIECEGIP